MSHISARLQTGLKQSLGLMKRSAGTPLCVSAAGVRRRFERLCLGSGTHDENWLQEVLHDHPEVLPITEIEPGFGTLLPAAREVPCGHGIIDNLFLTPGGDIVLVEVKLWRNTQIRREVVAQALDYASALASLSYDEFEKMVLRAADEAASLYALVEEHPETLAEADFIDAVARNLRRGRMIVLVAGDGMREETERLAGLLQSRVGLQFTFALVELAAWRDTAEGDLFIVPNTLAKTLLLERGVVRLEGDGLKLTAPPTSASGKEPKARSLSMEAFMELMAARDPQLPRAIEHFLQRLEPLGFYPEMLSSLNIKLDVPSLQNPLNIGYIQKNGQLYTSTASWQLPEAIVMPYHEALAQAIGGELNRSQYANFYVSVDGISAPRIEQLLPEHEDVWVAATETLVKNVLDAEPGLLAEGRS